MTSILSPFLSGFALSLALIMAIGAQNMFVLRQGLRREHVGPIVLFCGCADALLIAAGVGGVGAFLAAVPQLALFLTFGGAAFLAWYGIKALQRMASTDAMSVVAGEGLALGRAMAATAGFTFLNPHVYLDTVLLMGGGGIGATCRLAPDLRGRCGDRKHLLVRRSWLWCENSHAAVCPTSSVARARRHNRRDDVGACRVARDDGLHMMQALTKLWARWVEVSQVAVLIHYHTPWISKDRLAPGAEEPNREQSARRRRG